MADSSEWITEQALAEELGIHRGTLKAERPYLGPGEVDAQGENGSVRWLKSAAARVIAKLGLADFKKKLPQPAGTAIATDELLTVASLPQPHLSGRHFGNSRLIRARRFNGDLVIVRVADSEKYAPRLRTGQPMTLKATPAPAGNWWVVSGREPRWRGRP